MKNPILRTALLSTALLLTSACSGDKSTGPSTVPPVSQGNGSPVGTYVMQYVDNHAVPYAYDEGAVSGGTVKRYWMSGEAKFNADSSFSIKLVGKSTGPGQSGDNQTSSWTGTWRLEIGGVQLKSGGSTAHWKSADNLATLSAVGTYTKVAGGSGSVTLKFGKQ